MPNWKKLITSGSNAELNNITASGNISVAGNVGIGTTSPTEKLTVESGILLVTGSGPSGYGFQLDRAGSDTYRLSHLDGGLTVYNVDDARKEMTFDGSGNVGIGTAAPTEKLTVAGNISASGDLTFNGGPTIGTNDNSSITIEPEGSLFLGNGNQTDVVKIGRESGGPAGRVEIHANSATIAAKFESSTITFNHPITASSNISASGTVVGSNLSGINTGDQDLSGYIQSSQTSSMSVATASYVAGSDVDGAVASATNADTLDSLDSTQFVRSDANDTITGDITFGSEAKLIGTQASTTQDFSILEKFLANPAAEDGEQADVRILNNLAGANKWATITLTDCYQSDRTTAVTDLGSNAFDGTSAFSQLYQNAAGDPLVIQIDLPNQINWSAWVGIIFGHASWRTKSVKIETFRNGAWQTECDLTNQASHIVSRKVDSNDSNGVTKIKYTLDDLQNTSNHYIRILSLFNFNYRTGAESYGGVHYIDKYKNTSHYSTITPATDSTYDLGSTSLRYSNVYADTLHGTVTTATTASYVAAANIDGTIDISDQTNLAGGTNLTLSGDTMNLDANISLTSITASAISASGTVVGSNLSGTNTGNVTLAGSYDYITISGQEITRNQIDLSTDVTGQITTESITNFPTEVSRSAAAAGFGSGGGGAVATYTNGSDNRIITSTGTDGINGEANLTFDGTSLTLTGNITASGNISSSGTSDNFFGGRLVLDNSKYIAGTETGGTTRNILSIDGSDITQVANGNLATNIKGTSISIDNALTLDAGDFTVTNGNVRLFTNNTQITGRTSGGTERDIIGFNASDVVVVGNSSTDEIELTGNTKVVGNLTLDDAVDTTLTITGSVKFRIADATYTYQGELSPLAGTLLTAGEIYHYSGSGWVVADASDDTATKHLGVAVSATDVMIRGYIRNTAYAGLGTGNVIYLSTTAGDVTITPPSTAGEYVRVLGYCVDGGSRIIYFNPSQDWIEL